MRLTNGDTAVLTLSENGHDAQAIHLEIGKVVKISAGHWFTIETLGSVSVILDIADFKEIIAPPDWRPEPVPQNLIEVAQIERNCVLSTFVVVIHFNKPRGA